MFRLDAPTTCFGEPLRSGALKIAKFCAIKSLGLMIIFSVDVVSVLKYSNHLEFSLIPIGLVLLSAVKVVCNVLLYIGASRGIVKYLKPWFWAYTIQTVLLFLLGLGGSIALAIMHPNSTELLAINYVLVLMYCTLFSYLCQVVNGLIHEMQRGNIAGDTIRPTAFINEQA